MAYSTDLQASANIGKTGVNSLISALWTVRFLKHLQQTPIH